MKWYNCNDCDEEFRVITDSELTIEFCPFCGETVEAETDEEDSEDE